MTSALLHRQHARGRLLVATAWVSLALATVGCPQTDSDSAAPWPMYRHDSAHSGHSPYVGPTRPVVKWKLKPEGGVNGEVVIGAQGLLHFGSGSLIGATLKLSPDGKGVSMVASAAGGHVTAMAPDGVISWTHRVSGLVLGTLALGLDGAIIAAASDGHLHALSPDGTPRWEQAVGASCTVSPTRDSQGVLVLALDNGKVCALSPDGTLRWEYTSEWFRGESPALGPDGTVYIAAWKVRKGLVAGMPGKSEGCLIALTADGSHKWSCELGQWKVTAPAVAADGTVYVGATSGDILTPGGALFAVSASGRVKWSHKSDSGIMGTPALAPDGTVYAGTGEPAVATGGAPRAELLALLPTGKLAWKHDMGKGKLTSPVIAGDGTIYIAGGGAQVSAVKPTGETLWTVATETWPDHLSLSGDHTIWVTGQEGAVYGLCDPQ